MRILAETPDSIIKQGLAATLQHWRELGWDRFAEYFQRTWVAQLPGWWSGYLGLGTPDTTCGLEGIWPVIHRMVSGVFTPQRMIRYLMAWIVPYFARNRNAPVVFNRSLTSWHAATELAAATSDQLKCRVVDGEVQWFVRKRILGATRPLITDEDIDTYLELMGATNPWTYKEYMHVMSH